jgi:hypothetical protein
MMHTALFTYFPKEERRKKGEKESPRTRKCMEKC